MKRCAAVGERSPQCSAESTSTRSARKRSERSGKERAGDPGLARHPGSAWLTQDIDEPERPADLEDQQEQAEGDHRKRHKPTLERWRAAGGGEFDEGEQSGAGAAAEEVAGRFPVPVLLVPGLHPAGADLSGLGLQERGC